MQAIQPSYVELFESGELARRAHEAVQALANCALCPRRCHVDRLHEANPKSYCRSGRYARVASYFAHHGEEPCLSGWAGSGTIFFSNCNLGCVFCQNFDISLQGHGKTAPPDELAEVMLHLQEKGCHNINFVTPSHVVPQILEALVPAVERGLTLPIVYNTGCYDNVKTLEWLDGVVDIYMPDFKFSEPAVSKQLAHADDYYEVACEAIKEMHRQVGDLVVDNRGIAQRGLLVRHLVMPNGQAGTRRIMRFLARHVSPETYVNIMAQYHPDGNAYMHSTINRPLKTAEYVEAKKIAVEEGLSRFAKE